MTGSLGYNVTVDKDAYQKVADSYLNIVNDLETIVSDYAQIINNLQLEGETADSLRKFAEDVQNILSDSLARVAEQIGDSTKQFAKRIEEIDASYGR